MAIGAITGGFEKGQSKTDRLISWLASSLTVAV